jgi:hypothetical protein
MEVYCSSICFCWFVIFIHQKRKKKKACIRFIVFLICFIFFLGVFHACSLMSMCSADLGIKTWIK